jgi:nitric oxide reductase large subunit
VPSSSLSSLHGTWLDPDIPPHFTNYPRNQGRKQAQTETAAIRLDSSVGNVATTETYIWSIGGIVSLFVTPGLFIFWVHRDRLWYGEAKGVPLAEKLIDMPLTSSQIKAAKYFLVVILLFLVQTAFGGLLAHYTDS